MASCFKTVRITFGSVWDKKFSTVYTLPWAKDSRQLDLAEADLLLLPPGALLGGVPVPLLQGRGGAHHRHAQARHPTHTVPQVSANRGHVSVS